MKEKISKAAAKELIEKLEKIVPDAKAFAGKNAKTEEYYPYLCGVLEADIAALINELEEPKWKN